jgi:hypothetical protein
LPAITKMVAKFVVSRAEAGCGIEGSEPTHRIVALLDGPVILFESIVHVAAGPMRHHDICSS